MKKVIVIVLLLVTVHLFVTATASADPRMETNKNFCHFILDPNNTDNEVFVAGCDSVITVVEKTAAASTVQARCEEEQNYIAKGYAIVIKEIPQTVAPVSPGTILTFTSDDSATPCTMVESNGRAYKSNKWQSTVKVLEKRNGLLKVRFELVCQEGQQ